MAAPLIWLAVYLLAGSLVLWACYNSSFCRLSSRMERNQRITGLFSVSDQQPPVPSTPEPAHTAR